MLPMDVTNWGGNMSSPFKEKEGRKEEKKKRKDLNICIHLVV